MWFDTLRKENYMVREYFNWLGERKQKKHWRSRYLVPSIRLREVQKRLDAGENIVDIIIEEIKRLEIEARTKSPDISEERNLEFQMQAQTALNELKEILR